jgi:polysaccharide deacetylase 2 family uncharacterized protein YibQ
MGKKKSNNHTGLILAVVALLAAALGIRIFLKGGWRPPRLVLPGRAKPVRMASWFTDYIENLPDSVYKVKKITTAPDSGAYYQILADREKPFVSINLELTNRSRESGYEIKEAYEDTKKQWLRLLYSRGDTARVRILVKRKQEQTDSAVIRRPGICIVLYDWPPKDAKLAQAFLKAPEIGTLVVTQKTKSLPKAVLVTLPLEPKGYPREDPGPDAILVDHSAAHIRNMADKALKKYSGASGFYAKFGSRALEDGRVCGEVMKYCARKKLSFLEPQPTPRSLASALAEQEAVAYCKPDMVVGAKDSYAESARMLKRALQDSRAAKPYVLLAPPTSAFLKAFKETVGEKTAVRYEFLPITAAAGEKR